MEEKEKKRRLIRRFEKPSANIHNAVFHPRLYLGRFGGKAHNTRAHGLIFRIDLPLLPEGVSFFVGKQIYDAMNPTRAKT